MGAFFFFFMIAVLNMVIVLLGLPWIPAMIIARYAPSWRFAAWSLALVADLAMIVGAFSA